MTLTMGGCSVNSVAIEKVLALLDNELQRSDDPAYGNLADERDCWRCLARGEGRLSGRTGLCEGCTEQLSPYSRARVRPSRYRIPVRVLRRGRRWGQGTAREFATYYNNCRFDPFHTVIGDLMADRYRMRVSYLRGESDQDAVYPTDDPDRSPLPDRVGSSGRDPF